MRGASSIASIIVSVLVSIIVSVIGALLTAVGCGDDGGAEGGATDATSAATTTGSTASAATDATADGSTAGADGTPASSTGASEGSDGGDSTGEGGAVAPTYAEIQLKSSHNSYQRDEALVDQLVYHRVRSIELDIHTGKTFEPTVAGQWYVYHTDVIDDATSCRRLDDCLADVAVFTDAVPMHEVLTLWVDLKDDWDGTHTPAQLDAALDAAFGGALLSPDELTGACPAAASLAAAVTDPNCGWPRTTQLRGRVIVALTGGDLSAPDSPLSTYLAQGSRAFVAPSVAAEGDLARPSGGVAIYNANVADAGAATVAVDLGFVARVWDANDAGTFAAGLRSGAQHVGTDAVNLHEGPWAVTHAADGWPFSCPAGCEGAGPEPGPTLGIEVDSGDIWDTDDDFALWHRTPGPSPAGQWQALVSTENSWVEPFAKGCLMARAGLAANAAYFAVCRPADEEPLRAQWRATTGASSQATEHDIVPPGTVAPSSVAWVRLTVDATGLCATAWGAWRRGDWVEIDGRCFDEPLTVQGLAASGHEGGVARLLFVDPTHDGRSVAVDRLTLTEIGGASALGFEGPLP
jgi:hypothetical protein